MSYNDTQHRGGEAAGYYNPGDLSLNQDQAIRQAQYQKHGREDHEDDDSSLFSKAMSFLGDRKEKLGREDIDEQKVVNSHQKLYGDVDDRDEKHGAESLGSGAAMQALKMFLNDGGNNQNQNQNQDQGRNQSQGGGDQNKLIGMAMAQAGKLWEQKNQQGRVDTDKQTAVNMAAEYALKMYLKGQMGGGSTGAGALGGLGGLALISSALGGGGGGQKQQSGLAAIAGALGGSGGQQQQQQQQQQQSGAANLLNMASKLL